MYTALTETIAAFTGCSSEYKPVLTASYHQVVFTLPTATVCLSPVTQCTLSSLSKCVQKVYSEIMRFLLKGGLDGEAYYQILIPRIIFDIVHEALHLSLLFQLSALLNTAEDQSQQEERVWKKALEED